MEKDLSGGVSIETGVEGESLSYSGAFALTASVAGPDGGVATIDNHIASITLWTLRMDRAVLFQIMHCQN